MFWRLKSVPELAPLTARQRHRVHRRCLNWYLWYGRATPRGVAFYPTLIGGIFAGFWGSGIVLRASGFERGVWVYLAECLIGVLMGMYFSSRVVIPVLRPLYTGFLEGGETRKDGPRDVPPPQ